MEQPGTDALALPTIPPGGNGAAPYPSLRGRLLKALRARQGVGQVHLAHELGIGQPELSRLENEHYGGLPRGFSTRYQRALTNLGEHFPRCGCKL